VVVVLSLKPLKAGDTGDYYLRSLPDGPAEYYLGHGQEGMWLGAGAGRLGLEGPVSDTAFRRVLAGTHPHTGDPLVSGRAASNDRIPAFDLTISSPKSATLLAALSDPQIADAVREGHRQAVIDTVAFIETEVARARRGHDGIRQLPVGIVAAGFEHHTSRALDPQLHTHVVLANLGWATDERWSALYGRRLFGWAKTAGIVYQAALRANLTETLGIEWGPMSNGVAEVAGVSRPQIEAFSVRWAEIQTELHRVGHGSARAAQLAAWGTRPPKPDAAEDALIEQWRRRALEVGITDELLAGLLGQARDPALDQPADQLVTSLLGPKGLTAHASAFDRRHVVQAIATAHRHGLPVQETAARADRLLTDERAVVLPEPTRLGDHRYSTAELLTVERELLDRSRQAVTARFGIADAAALASALALRPTLSSEQKQMIERVTTSGAGVEVVVGRAGTGKTYALDAARDAWKSSGQRVVGAALAARAAAELQAGAGIPSTTLDRLLLDAEHPGAGGGLPARGVVVVDESGMVGTRKLARLVALAERYQTKIVLVGDARQLPEIEAGGAFNALSCVVPVTELVDNRRQLEAWERAALAELRGGDVAVAVENYLRRDRLTMARDAEVARQRLIEDWWEARTKGEHCAIYALRRSDVDDLNRRAREHLADAGLLHGEPLHAADHEFAVGDEVLALRNDRRLAVRNGTRATVTAIDYDARTLKMGTADGGSIDLPATYLDAGHLGLGYATTIHKSQGATVGRAFVLGSDALYREAGYVALSRARVRTDLYVVAGEQLGQAIEADLDPITRLVADLRRSQAQQLATPETSALVPFATRPLSDLEAERDELRTQLERPPQVPNGDAERDFAVARVVRATAEGRLAGIGDLPRRQRVAARPLAEADLVTATARERRAEVAWRIEQETQQTWERWHADNADLLERYRVVQHAIGHRRQAIEAAVLADPGQHLIGELGPPPLTGPGRQRWAETALAIDRYRERWGITDPTLALGPEPERPEQRRQQRHIGLAIQQFQQSVDLTRQLDTGLEL
jgi:conjugative relaxase-like TrwC/TraI family protein